MNEDLKRLRAKVVAEERRLKREERAKERKRQKGGKSERYEMQIRWGLKR